MPAPEKKRGPAKLGGGKRKNRDQRKEARRAAADLREGARNARTDKEQLQRLTDKGFRAKAERKRLK